MDYDRENTNKFISDLKQICEKSNIELDLVEEKNIQLSDNICVQGYFDDGSDEQGKPILKCAIGGEINTWLPILIHESCHADQWIENDPTWLQSDKLINIDNWLEGQDLTDGVLNESISSAIEIELNCEKRTVEKIKKYNLDSIIDIDTYIQKANSYLFFYLYVKKYRKWSIEGKSPYGVLVYPHAPSSWVDDYKVIPIDLEKAFDEHLGLKQ